VDALRLRVAVFPTVTLLVGAVFFLVPLGATFEFSLRTASGHGWAAYRQIVDDSQFWSTLGLSLKLALETSVLLLVLLVPTAYFVHLRAPRLRPVIAFVCVLPFVVPPIVLIVGLLGVFRGAPDWWLSTPQFLVPGYVVLSLPYGWFALDAGLRAIDVKTMSEAAHSLGAGPARTLVQVILPSLRAAMLAAVLLAFAIVLGEFTMASLALFNTFPAYVNYVGHTTVTGGAALTIFSFVLLWTAMLGLTLAVRTRRRVGVR
jgi:putative spermidine/putrescine transport system permease protein